MRRHPHCDLISCHCVCREMRKCEPLGRHIAIALNDLALPSRRYRAVRVSRTQRSINPQAHCHFSPPRFFRAPRNPTADRRSSQLQIEQHTSFAAHFATAFVRSLSVRPSVLSCVLVHQALALGISLWLGRSSLCGDAEPHIGPGFLHITSKRHLHEPILRPLYANATMSYD